MKVSYSLNGQPLDSERMRVIVGTTHYTSLSPIVDTVQVSGRSGVIVGSSVPVLDAPELTIKVAAWGADSDALISRFRAMCLSAAKLTLGRVETTEDGRSRSMVTRVVCTSCEPDDDERPSSDLRVMTAVFQLPDVFWRGVQWQEVTLAASGAGCCRAGSPSRVARGIGRAGRDCLTPVRPSFSTSCRTAGCPMRQSAYWSCVSAQSLV